VGNRSYSVTALLFATLAAAALVIGSASFLLGTVVGPPQEPVVGTPELAASSAAPGLVSSPTSALDRASNGDREAMRALLAKPAAERAPDETIALALGQAVEKRQKLTDLAAELKRTPTLFDDPAVRKKLLDHADDRATGVEALRVIASLGNARAADMLYEVWTGTANRTEVTELAESLIYSRAIRPQASPALAVALDLRRAERCEQHLEIIPRARDVGDRRSLHLLARLLRRHGCGPRKTGDCYRCLREGDELKEALKAVRSRPEPKLR
jgi:hypothetical protein